MGPFIAYGCFCHLRIRFSKHCGDSLFIRRLAQCTIWQKIWSVEAVEMRDSASTRKRREKIHAKVPLNCLPDKFANFLTEPQVLLSHNFLSRYVLHTKYVVPKEKWWGLLTLWLSRKSDAALQIICQEDLADIQDVNQVQISSLLSFQKLRWRELCTAYQISFLSQAICNSIPFFWSDNSVMAIKVTGLQNLLIFPCETCKNYSSSFQMVEPPQLISIQ